MIQHVVIGGTALATGYVYLTRMLEKVCFLSELTAGCAFAEIRRAHKVAAQPGKAKRITGQVLGSAAKFLSAHPTLDAVVSHAVSPSHLAYMVASAISMSLGFFAARDERLKQIMDDMEMRWSAKFRARMSFLMFGALGGCYTIGQMTRLPVRLASISLARLASPYQSEIAIEERETTHDSLEKHLHDPLILIVLEYLGDTEAEVREIAIRKIIQDDERRQGRIRAAMQRVSRITDGITASIHTMVFQFAFTQ